MRTVGHEITPPTKIVIASRKSALAMWQARFVERQLQILYPQTAVEILGITTQGDRVLDSPLSKLGGKGLFVKELEQALESGAADIAVHSMKDVPANLPPGFGLAAILEREDPRDAYVSAGSVMLAQLRDSARVGTSSLRRECQLRAVFPRLKINMLRGNVETRLRKLDQDEYDAIILAAAGLKRLGLESRITAILEPEQSLPAVGQGALGIECRSDRNDLIECFQVLNHNDTALCVRAERAMSAALGGNCQLPLAGYAEITNNKIRLRGFVSTRDGTRSIKGEEIGDANFPDSLGAVLAQRLIDQGAKRILEELE